MIVSKTLKIADELEKMINERYSPGDRFYTAHQLATEKKISGTTANNVLKILEHRQIITRSQGKGSFIANHPIPEVTRERIVIVLYQPGNMLNDVYEQISIDNFSFEIQQVFPNHSIQVIELNENINDETLMAAISSAGDISVKASYILWSVPLVVQRFFVNSKFPCVIYGTRFPSVPKLVPSVDRNIPETVRLIRHHLRGNNRKCFVCLFHSAMLAGDILTFDEFQMVFRHEDIFFKLLPFDESLYESEIAQILESIHPDAFICQTDQMAEVAARCCRSRGIEPGNMADIIIFMDSVNGRNSPFPHIVEDRNNNSQGLRIGKLLKSVQEGKITNDVLIPVQLVIPGSSGMSLNKVY